MSMSKLASIALVLFASTSAPDLAAAENTPVQNNSCPEPSAGTITYPEIVAKYADKDSKFIVLEGKDGIRVHYKDEGSGPAILLIHSSLGDLKDWDPWVEVLRKDYRVIRLDLPAFGLTGIVPSGNYSIERFLTLIDALMDHLDIQRFAIAGISYGGPVAFRYAGTRVDRVTALILGSSAGIEYGGHGGTVERERDPTSVYTPSTRRQSSMADGLVRIINDPKKVTPELVTRKTDYANVVCRDWESFIATQLYERGNPERVLSHVRAPSLVFWGDKSAALSVETAQVFVDALKNAKTVQKIIYNGGGHLLHIERPLQTAKDVKRFLDQNIR